MKFPALILALAAVPALAADKKPEPPSPDVIDWRPCASEIRDFKCTGSDKQIYRCLVKQVTRVSANCEKLVEYGDRRFREKKSVK